MIQKGLSQTSAYGASLQPVIPGGSSNLGFFASSGKITVGNRRARPPTRCRTTTAAARRTRGM